MSNVNLAKSTEIYRTIMNGKVINHYLVSADGSQFENPLFTEIYYNFNNYKQQYLMSGFDLVVKDDFYYAREVDSDMPFTDSVKRIQTLLLIISRYVTLSGALFEKLTNTMGGVTTEDIQKMSENEEYTEILEAVEIKSLVSGIKTHLIDRNIMIEPRSDRYILSDAGKFFFNELFSR